jgi:LmbE family N-acetylglucosaminyl deacetylase
MEFNNILAIGAHPDDIEYSCFGFLLKQQEQGSKIYACVLSPDSLNAGTLAQERTEESVKALRLIPNIQFFIRDKNNIDESQYQTIADELRNIVLKNNIDTVLIHSKENDTMQEHRLLHDITMTALRRLPITIILYRSPSISNNFISNFIVDIANQYPIKLQAIKEHKTQLDKPYMSNDSIEIFNKNWNGKSIGIDYVEEFNIIRMVG